MSVVVQTVVSEDYVEEASLTVIIISLAVCIFGIVGNFIAIFIIVTLKEYQKSITHWYILHLAIADTIFLLTLPFQVSSEMNQYWIYPEWMCRAKETILFCNYYASTFLLTVMSIDRYFAVCKSFSSFSKILRKRKAAIVIVSAVWIIAFAICIPIILFSTIRGSYPKCKCTYEFPKPPKNDCLDEGSGSGLCEHAKLFNPQSQDDYCMPKPDNNESIALGGAEDFLNLLPEDYRNQIDFYSSGDYKTNSIEGLNHTTTNISYPSKDENDDQKNIIINARCHYDGHADGFISYLLLNFLAMFVVPLVIMVFCYGLIVFKLSKTQVKTVIPSSSLSANGSKTTNQRKKSTSRSQTDRLRVTIMCAALVTSFVICWLPFHAVHLAKIAGIRETKTKDCDALLKLGVLLAFMNSALNPYLYSFLGTNFRKRWRSASLSLRRSISASSRRSSSGSFVGLRPPRNRERKSSNTGLTKLSKAPKVRQSVVDAGMSQEHSKETSAIASGSV